MTGRMRGPVRIGYCRAQRVVWRALVLGSALLTLGGCATTASTRPPAAAAAAGTAADGPPYYGLELRRAADGRAEIDTVAAGPAALAGIAPGGRILTLDGAALDVDGVAARLQQAVPGTTLTLGLERGGQPLRAQIAVTPVAPWLAPADFAANVPTLPPAPASINWVGQSFDLIARTRPEVLSADARLTRMFAALTSADSGYNKLPLVRDALAHPAAFAARAATLRNELATLATTPSALPQMFCTTLALPCPPPSSDTAMTLDDFVAGLASADAAVTRAFRALPATRDVALADARALVTETAAGHQLFNQPAVVAALRATRYSMQVDYRSLLQAFALLLALADASPPAASASVTALPVALAALVSGEILAYRATAAGYVVIGGSGPNRYTMDGLVAVIDTGGDDVYLWGDGAPPPVQVIIDAAGNDRYAASFSGAGAAWFGVNVIIDRGGNDSYRSVFGGCGAGIFGFALLLDAGGDDRYQCDAWSEGAGLYGGGALIDSGGNDSYLAQILSQGVGGPRGMGVLLDTVGDDLYRANGLVASAYGTSGVFLGLSQGVGYGLRPHDHGGVGVLYDGGGDDRYEGGEFSQGGGYFWGAGLLFDESGNDLYYGNRYAQAFAAHQAMGLLFDGGGDDHYWSMTAAAQGAAWDQSLALLYDRRGNDDYRAGTLSQGAAAEQSRALLFDAAGDDVYWAATTNAQGAAGVNGYHFAVDDPIASMGALFDGGGHDRYSSGFHNDAVRVRASTPAAGNNDDTLGVALDGECRRGDGDALRLPIDCDPSPARSP